MTQISNVDVPDSDAQGVDLLGAVDIVEAFTALRNELKLQVRGGRELQQTLVDSLQRIDQRLASQSIAIANAPTPDSFSESRKLAESIAEIEESLHRALSSLVQSSKGATIRHSPNTPSSLQLFDEAVKGSSWLVRKFAGPLISIARRLIEDSINASNSEFSSLDSTRKGLELLHSRLVRLMQHCEMERVEVLGKPFDPESMHAIDRIDASSVPSGYVAEQIRPAYLWHNQILRFADVRIAN